MVPAVNLVSLLARTGLPRSRDGPCGKTSSNAIRRPPRRASIWRLCCVTRDAAVEAKADLQRVLRFDPTSATAHRVLDEDANVLKP
jgi:hypothetical protein